MRTSGPSLVQPRPSLPVSHGMLTITTSLSAREDKVPPLGLPLDPDREIGFATVFVHLENQLDTQQVITFQAIEILAEPEQQIQPFDFEPKKIALKPLEHAVIDLHLRNRNGYSAHGLVKAIVHYQIGQQPSAMVASPAVAIERQ